MRLSTNQRYGIGVGGPARGLLLLAAVFHGPALWAEDTAGSPERRIAPQRGIVAGGAYQLSDIETVNMSNGGLTLRIPLAQLPVGPGGLSGGAVLTYNSKYWTSQKLSWGADPTAHLSGETGGGWLLHLGYTLESVTVENTSADPCPWGDNHPEGLRLIEPDGSEHTFYLKDFPINAYADSCEPGLYRPQDAKKATGGTWYTLDGSYLRLVVGPSAEAHWPNYTWTLYRPDGTRVERRTDASTFAATTRLIDRKGNTAVTWKQLAAADPLPEGEELTDEYGHWIRIYHFDGYDEVRQSADPGKASCGETRARITFDDGTRYPFPSYRADSQTNWTPVPFDTPPQLVTEVKLPRPYELNGTECREITGTYPSPFQFEYNATFRELSKVTLPTGAEVLYSWTLDGTNSTPMYYLVLANGLTSKTVRYGPVSSALST